MNHLIDHSDEFKIDTNRIIFAGDSAGGNIAAVLTQKFSKINPKIPKLQVLIYPWLQLYNLKLPSHLKYKPSTVLSYLTFSVSKLAFWYLGESKVTDDMKYLIETNSHIYAIDDENMRKKFNSYLDTSLIPDEYKMGKSYYNKYTNYVFNESNKEEYDRIIEENKDLKTKLVNLFNPDLSPGLADDELLKNLPNAYFIILEWDVLKDEGLIYAERLKRNNCSVTVAYYENAFHGILTYIDENYGYRISKIIFNNLTDYILKNV